MLIVLRGDYQDFWPNLRLPPACPLHPEDAIGGTDGRMAPFAPQFESVRPRRIGQQIDLGEGATYVPAMLDLRSIADSLK